MTTLTLSFRNDGHVTKRTFRFQEIDDNTNRAKDQGDCIIGKIYIKKDAVSAVPPDEIKVTLEW